MLKSIIYCTSRLFRSKRKEVRNMLEVILSVTTSIVAGVAVYYICKWLDGE